MLKRVGDVHLCVGMSCTAVRRSGRGAPSAASNRCCSVGGLVVATVTPARASERGALDALERVQGVLSAQVEASGVESILNHVHEHVGERAGLHVTTQGVDRRS